ncbi:MAG TPA: stage II sporulation protein M [Terriglobales bacterium]|jgi:uncharacterized membrane protein SpoIIM required for sporulation
MIFDLDRFTSAGKPRWQALSDLLDQLESAEHDRITLAEAEALEDLYHRCAADLNRLQHGAVAGPLHAYLSQLVTRAYAQIYSAGGGAWPAHFAPAAWLGQLRLFFGVLPRVFRRNLRLFWLALALTLAGCLLGALAITFDPAATDVLLPAEYLRNPAQRVQQDLGGAGVHTPNASEETAFSAQLITHNIQVSLFTMALGVTFGVGTGLLLFFNGLLLGAVAARYCQQGFAWFVAGWLLPHGAFEIPSVLIAGQAGFLLARMLLRGSARPELRQQALRQMLTLFGGLCCLLVWAGLMEAFFSQHHAAGWGYAVQVVVGLAELLLLFGYLGWAGRSGDEAPTPVPELAP